LIFKQHIPNAMKFVLFSQWNQLPANADRLFGETEQDSFFFSQAWFENITSHALADDHTVVLICVVDEEGLLAMLPMMKCSQGTLSSLSSRFTSLYSLLIIQNNQHSEILTCLAKGLSQYPTPSIHFDPVDTNDSNMIHLCEAMQSFGFQSHNYFRFYNWIHPVNGQSFNEYMAQRPSHLCNTIKRKQRKLEREHHVEIELYRDTEVEQALLDYQAVYHASWKANEFFSDFTPTLVRSLSQLDWLRLGILYVNKKAIAAQIWFVVHGKANIYRLAYDEHWKSYSPGSILTQYVMRYVIDTDKVSEIDFLTGNESYKKDWMSVRKERIGMRLAKPQTHINRFKRILTTLKNLL